MRHLGVLSKKEYHSLSGVRCYLTKYGACLLKATNGYLLNDMIVCRRFAGCVLFFGCRNSKKDFFFKEEWEPLVENGKLQLFTAFSRDQVRPYPQK